MSTGAGGTVSKNVSGFTQFLNDFGIRAFDELAARRAVAEPHSSEEPSPLDRLATRWSALNPAEKEEVVKRLLLAGSAVGVAVPALTRARRAAKTRKAKSRAAAASPRAPLATEAAAGKPGTKRDAEKADKKKDDRAKKEKKKQKKLMKEEKKQQKKEKKRKKKDQKKER